MTLDNRQNDLVIRCQRGERHAQFTLYHQYSKAMFNICRRMLYDQMEAEDVLQNSFIDVFTKIRSFRGESTIGAWIKRIVINNCINQIKKKKIETNAWDDRYGNIPEEEEESYRTEDIEVVKKAIKELPQGYRAVFSLYAIEGYDHQEIGEILGVSEATSKSQYSRAKRKIRQLVSARLNKH